MMAAPAELWDSYLHALEAAPLLTKVWESADASVSTAVYTYNVPLAGFSCRFPRYSVQRGSVPSSRKQIGDFLHVGVSA